MGFVHCQKQRAPMSSSKEPFVPSAVLNTMDLITVSNNYIVYDGKVALLKKVAILR